MLQARPRCSDLATLNETTFTANLLHAFTNDHSLYGCTINKMAGVSSLSRGTKSKLTGAFAQSKLLLYGRMSLSVCIHADRRPPPA
jgi:hypothetical protein